MVTRGVVGSLLVMVGGLVVATIPSGYAVAGLLQPLRGSATGRMLGLVVVLVGLGSFFDLYEVFLGGVLAPILAKEFALGSVGKAAVVASGFLGMFVGAATLSVVADRLGRRRVVTMSSPIMGAEDFSYVLQKVPGALAFLGACPPAVDPATAPPNHSNRVVFDESAMPLGAAVYAALALDALRR